MVATLYAKHEHSVRLFTNHLAKHGMMDILRKVPSQNPGCSPAAENTSFITHQTDAIAVQTDQPNSIAY